MSLSALVIAVLAVLLIAVSTVLWLFWRQLQVIQQQLIVPTVPAESPIPSLSAEVPAPPQGVESQSSPPAPVSSPPVVLASRRQPSIGLISQGPDWNQQAVAWELAQAEGQQGHTVLLIDTDPAQGLARQLQVEASATPQEIAPGLQLCSLSADHGDVAQQLQQLLSQAERVLVCLPPLTHSQSPSSLASLDQILLVSPLDLNVADTLAETAARLQSQLTSRQTLWGLQITHFDAQNADSQALYTHLQQQRPELLLAPPRPVGDWRRVQAAPDWAQTLSTRLPLAEHTLVNV